MRFTVETIHITDAAGMALRPPNRIETQIVDADNVDDALQRLLAHNGAMLIGEVQRFPGLHAVATARAGQAVYTLQVMPASDERPGER